MFLQREEFLLSTITRVRTLQLGPARDGGSNDGGIVVFFLLSDKGSKLLAFII